MAATDGKHEMTEAPESGPGPAGRPNPDPPERHAATRPSSGSPENSHGIRLASLLADILSLANGPRPIEPRFDLSRVGDLTLGNRALRRAAFDAMPVAQLVLDPDDNLILATGLARRMFALTDADLDRPINELKPFSCPVDLKAHLDELRGGRQPIAIRPVVWEDGPNELVLDVRIVSLALENGLAGTSISYNDIAEPHRLQRQLVDIRRELAHAYDQLLATVEQFEIQLEQQRTTIDQLEIANKQLLSVHTQLELTDGRLVAVRQALAILSAARSSSAGEQIASAPDEPPGAADRDSH